MLECLPVDNIVGALNVQKLTHSMLCCISWSPSNFLRRKEGIEKMTAYQK